MNLKPYDSFDIYSDGLFWDSEAADYTADIPFYLRQAERYGGPILDMGCGTGRISLPLTQAGYDVVGLEISAPMLEQARNKAAKAGLSIEWIEADCREFSVGRRFALILFPFNAIAHIHDRESCEALFARVREHLRPDGRFVFDWFNPNFKYLQRDPAERFPVTEFTDPRGRGKVTVVESSRYDSASQINHIAWYYKIGDSPEIVRELNMRQWFPQELDTIIHYNGLNLEVKYGDFDESPFSADSRRQICVCTCREPSS